MLTNLALARGSLDRLAERRGDDVWLRDARRADDRFVVGVRGGEVAVDGDTLRNCRDLDLPDEEFALLGAVDGRPCFARFLDEDRPDLANLRNIGAALGDDEAALATAAVALHQWHLNHTHCPRCGAPTRNALAGWERHCSLDGTAHYPRTDPAVIVCVLDAAERLLLARQHVWAPKRFSLVAGYVEPGETAEHAVRREVLEEVGVRIGAVEYLGSQPWPFPASLMLAFRAQALHTEYQVDGVEIEEAMWVEPAALADLCESGALLLPGTASIARRAIEDWYGADLPAHW